MLFKHLSLWVKCYRVRGHLRDPFEYTSEHNHLYDIYWPRIAFCATLSLFQFKIARKIVDSSFFILSRSPGMWEGQPLVSRWHDQLGMGLCWAVLRRLH